MLPTPQFVSRAVAAQVPFGQPLLVAVSGGADSMALLHLLQRAARWPLLVAHVHHGLRAAATADAQFVAEYCAQHGLPCYVHHADAPAHSAATGASAELAARQLRHAALQGLRLQHGAAAVVLAHHADDQAETVLLRLLRGTGLHGLAAMQPWDAQARLLRPLLGYSRADLQRYIRECGVPHVHDETNDSTDADRNYLRHAVLPLLHARWPGFGSGLTRLSAQAGDAQAYVAAAAAAWWQGQPGHALLAGVGNDAYNDADRSQNMFKNINSEQKPLPNPTTASEQPLCTRAALLAAHPAVATEALAQLHTALAGSRQGLSASAIDAIVAAAASGRGGQQLPFAGRTLSFLGSQLVLLR